MLAFEDFYLRAYWHLTTERTPGQPIPHSRILEYGERSGLDAAMMDVFVALIWKLDGAHRKWVSGEHDRLKMIDGPSPAKRAKNKKSQRG